MPFPPTPDPLQHCQNCAAVLARRRFHSGTLEDLGAFTRRKFCGRACMAAWMTGRRKGASETSRHREASRQAKTACETCGRTPRALHVHHVDQDTSNNAPANLRTLCASCHRRSHSPNFDETGSRRAPCELCEKPARVTGLCYTHLTRKRRYGAADAIPPTRR